MGYRYPVQTIRFEGEPDTTFAGLWIEVKQVRTGEELRALMLNKYWSDVLPIMAPYIVGWNYEGYREVSEEVAQDGAYEARTVTRLELQELPAPAEHPESLQLADIPVWEWIRGKLISSLTWKPEGDDPKAQTPSPSTPDGERSGTSTESPDTAKPKSSRRSRGS